MTTARVNIVWAALCAVTAASWWLGHHSRGDQPGTSNAAITLAALGLALFKVRLIVQQFMEVATAPTWLRRCTDGWLIVFWGAVLTIYLA